MGTSIVWDVYDRIFLGKPEIHQFQSEEKHQGNDVNHADLSLE
jgi:hypothetical protein